MIVRINQIDVSHAERASGWPAHGPAGPIHYVWPGNTYAYEVLILPTSEDGQPLTPAFRQAQLRQLIPEILVSLRGPADQVLVRLDGAIIPGELVAAYGYMTDAHGYGRFSMSAAEKLLPESGHIYASVRIQPQPKQLVHLCGDPALGLERGVRLRAFSVPEYLINPLLDTVDAEDERWPDILAQAAYMMSTTFGLTSAQIITPHIGPQEIRTRVMERLTHLAEPWDSK